MGAGGKFIHDFTITAAIWKAWRKNLARKRGAKIGRENGVKKYSNYIMIIITLKGRFHTCSPFIPVVPRNPAEPFNPGFPIVPIFEENNKKRK